MNTLQKNSSRLPDDAEVAARARAVFQGACAATDAYHASRLGQARRQAIHADTVRPMLRTWAPLAGAAACCALVVGVVWMHPGLRTHPTSQLTVSASATSSVTQDDDATPELGTSQVEMVQNLDFYRWLATQPTLAAAPTSGAR